MYYLHLQIYVTRVDLVVNIVSLVFIGLELLLAPHDHHLRQITIQGEQLAAPQPEHGLAVPQVLS